jgi:membrane-associated protease RseP (regulator of RpoE activity)
MRPLALLLTSAALFAASEDYNANAAANQRPMLGIEMSPVANNIQDREGLDAHQGVQVQSVYSGTAAEQMGLQKDDVVLGVNGQPITSMTDLRNEVGLTAVGDPISVQVSRNGQVVDYNSQVKPWPDQIPYEKLDPAAEKRFRDWQDRRQQRLADDVARMAKDAEKLRQQLAGEDDSAADAARNHGLDLAFRFTYAVDAQRAPSVDAPEVDQTLATVADVPAFRLSFALGTSLTTL